MLYKRHRCAPRGNNHLTRTRVLVSRVCYTISSAYIQRAAIIFRAKNLATASSRWAKHPRVTRFSSRRQRKQNKTKKEAREREREREKEREKKKRGRTKKWKQKAGGVAEERKKYRWELRRHCVQRHRKRFPRWFRIIIHVRASRKLGFSCRRCISRIKQGDR